MKRGLRTSRVITIACLACGALPDDRRAGEISEWAAAAASAR
jgi:hypothetical protein